MAEVKKRILTKDQILAAEDVKVEEVEVPEWGGVVLVRGMTGIERDEFESKLVVGEGPNAKVDTRNVRAKLVAFCVVDEEGNRIFSDADVELLGKKSAAALQRVFDVAQRLSGMKEDSVKQAIKGLGETVSAGSPSG